MAGRAGLWANADFLKLWAGQTISQLGTQVTLLALPLIAAVLLQASPLEMGILAAAEMAPFLLIGLPAGVWVDRLPRRPLLVAGDVGRAAALGTIPLAYALGALGMTQLYLVAFATGTLTVFFDVAYMSYLPSLVGRSELIEGNSKMEATRAGAQVVGPGLGGTLVQLLSAPVAIALDCLSFLVSAVFLLFIRGAEAPPAEQQARTSMRAEIGEGLRYVFTHPLLRPIASSTATSNLCSSAMWALYILFAVNELGLSAATLGLVFAVGNIGLLLGALFSSRLSRRFGLGATIIGAAMVSGLGGLHVPLATPATAVALLIASQTLVGTGNVVYNVNQVSLRQAITPDRLQGRMNATVRFVVWGTMPVGSLLGGVLGEWLGLRPAILLAAAGATLAFLWMVASPVRTLRQQPSPAEP